MPFVWKDYDKSGRIVFDEWQRISDPDELISKLSDKSLEKRLKSAVKNYEKDLPSVEDYMDLFDRKLSALLK